MKLAFYSRSYSFRTTGTIGQTFYAIQTNTCRAKVCGVCYIIKIRSTYNSCIIAQREISGDSLAGNNQKCRN